MVVKALRARQRLPVGRQCWPPEREPARPAVRARHQARYPARGDGEIFTIPWCKGLIDRARRQLHCRGSTTSPLEDESPWQQIALRDWEDAEELEEVPGDL
jgi:hypothetical protein